MTIAAHKSLNIEPHRDYLRHPLTPFLIAFGGTISDYLTTKIGLQMGFVEAHPQYHPLWSLIVFFSIITILTVLLPPQKPLKQGITGIASISYLGTLHNALVILSVFPYEIISILLFFCVFSLFQLLIWKTHHK